MTSRTATLLKLTGLLAAPALSLPLLIQPAKATALTGDFDLGNWTLLRTVNTTPYDPNPLPDPDYLCNSGTTSSLSCVNIPNPAADPATFAVIGSSDTDIGTSGDLVDIAWSMTYGGAAPGLFSFLMDFNNGTDTSASDKGYFAIDGVIVPGYELSSPPTSPLSYSGLLSPGQTITFGVYTSGNDGDPGTLAISQFQFNSVPGPLPILGAGAAFGWSRRLRSRIRRRAS